jgi:hypothetical protein
MWQVLIKVRSTFFSSNFNGQESNDQFDSKPFFEPLLVFPHFQINARPLLIFLFEDIFKNILKTQFE